MDLLASLYYSAAFSQGFAPGGMPSASRHPPKGGSEKGDPTTKSLQSPFWVTQSGKHTLSIDFTTSGVQSGFMAGCPFSGCPFSDPHLGGRRASFSLSSVPTIAMGWAAWLTANLRTNMMDFRGFDSSIILILRGGILMSIGYFPENLRSSNLSRDNVSREIGPTAFLVERRRVAMGTTQATPTTTPKRFDNYLNMFICYILRYFKFWTCLKAGVGVVCVVPMRATCYNIIQYSIS